MRQILVERARARGAQKRWGGMNRVSMTESLQIAADPETMLPALDEAIEKLEKIDPEQAKIVELRYFAGMSIEDGGCHGHVAGALAPVGACQGVAVPRTEPVTT
jgi:DNA-directed RNA polymerase specialized sigma24 family protein